MENLETRVQQLESEVSQLRKAVITLMEKLKDGNALTSNNFIAGSRYQIKVDAFVSEDPEFEYNEKEYKKYCVILKGHEGNIYNVVLPKKDYAGRNLVHGNSNRDYVLDFEYKNSNTLVKASLIVI